MKVISATFLLLFSSCMNILNREDEASNKTRFTFQYCNQNLGAPFVENNCTKISDTPLRDVRFCSECPNVTFSLSKEGLIYNIFVGELSSDEFLNYLKKFTTELGPPQNSENEDSQRHAWLLKKQGISIVLSKRVDKVNTNSVHFRLDVDDIHAAGFK
jgi:hypothetical protein